MSVEGPNWDWQKIFAADRKEYEIIEDLVAIIEEQQHEIEDLTEYKYLWESEDNG